MTVPNPFPKESKSASRQPSSLELAEVYAAFDAEALQELCEEWDFSDYATKVTLPGDNRFYWYQDNGSDILAVAHLDTVQPDRSCQVIDTAAGLLAVSGGLDDRLGVYVILELLPALGITCDWLLTTDEEMGQSTASEFAQDYRGKQYNWIIQFDRAGTDVVMYEYETEQLAELVKASGAPVGIGTYSDICELEDLRCAAFNWGVGYEEYHSPRSHAWLADTFRSVARFVRFHSMNADKYLYHDPYAGRWSKSGSTTTLSDDDWWESIEADCGHLVDIHDEDTWYRWADATVCRDCYEELTDWQEPEERTG